MKGNGLGGSKQTLAKNQDVPVTKGELGNEIKRITSEHLPTILAQVKKTLGRQKKLGKLHKMLRKRKGQIKMPRGGEKDSNPVIVINWLREIEDIFEISECSPRQRVKYASHSLKGEALHWWNMIKIACGDDVASVMT
ncbi:hypothetical protein Tco_0754662 [Tanacetum coccineum]